MPSIESFDLMYIRGTTPEILRESNKAPVSFVKVVTMISPALSLSLSLVFLCRYSKFDNASLNLYPF